MKHFIFVVLLLLTVIVNAQLAVEEIAYVPSRLGFYNNLIVKGNATINNLNTQPFNIRTHGSITTLNIPNSAISIPQLTIANGTVSSQGSAYMVLPKLNSGEHKIAFGMNGGSISASRTQNVENQTANFYIQAIQHDESVIPVLSVYTEDYIDPYTSGSGGDIYILNMKLPMTAAGSYWQPVKIKQSDGTYKKYIILVIHPGVDGDHPKEEVCLWRNTANPSNMGRYRWRKQTTNWAADGGGWHETSTTTVGPYECYDTTQTTYITNGHTCDCSQDEPPNSNTDPCWPHPKVQCGIINENDNNTNLPDPFTNAW
ncbi:MAG: hypothetical protein J5594_03080 [Elusimicrobiaceae bacterium]|nr:hypothetical protein [Elusimicrobiaceae bacterium]